jgi:hypothetical protein
MRRAILLIGIVMIFLSSCTTTEPISKSVAYKGIYNEKPVTILLMPPINRSTNVEAKEYFHSTLNIPIVDAGYYVIPPFLSMEILKKESAYDAELFLNTPLNKFGEVFGADLALFTIIHKWDKSGLMAKIYVEVEYIFKSVKTNEIVYSRKGNIIYDASVNTGAGGGIGLIANMVVSAINTAATKYVDVARKCNSYTFKDLPTGKYGTTYGTDGAELAGKKDFTVRLNSQYR